MSVSSATAAKGTVLKRGDGATPTEVFTSILEVISISGPSYSQETIEVTNMDSTNFFSEFVAGKKSAGEISIEANFVPGTTAAQTLLLTDLVNSTLRNFKLTRTTVADNTVAFSALVTGVEYDHSINSKNSVKFKLKISGVPVITTV